MSINHLSSDLPETLERRQPHPPHMMESARRTPSSKLSQTSTSWSRPQVHHPHIYPSTTATSAPMTTAQNTNSFTFNLNHEDEEELDEQVPDETENPSKDEWQEQEFQREAMFEKPLTPSDVGKLNRLVIPKQYAEKYFPLGGVGGDPGEKGFLLSFEDESGKSWKFRYSYWNSSQSYVLTKGWSRFVKEKRLDAGDIVLFHRHRVDGGRLFIGWRRRQVVQDSGVVAAQPVMVAVNSGDGGGGWSQVCYSAHPYPSHSHGPHFSYQPDCLHAGSVMQNQTAPSGNSKRLRLFGVNMECQSDESEPLTPTGSPMSSQGQANGQYYASTHHNHMLASSFGANQINFNYAYATAHV
ncbi:hypothetical protein RJ639_031216, partial [Escallonia herrerae]